MNGVVVAGGGLAGAAAACRLARAGEHVTLLERTRGPADKICGEFLSHEAQAELADLGIDLAGLGAHPITHLRLVRGSRTARLRLPFDACGLSRRRLDEALLAQAARRGADIQRGVSLRPGRAQAGQLFLATGKHAVRGHSRLFTPADLVGFKSYFTLRRDQHEALAHHIELHLFSDGYAGLQRVEDATNLCLLVSAAHLQSVGDWRALLARLCEDNPGLGERLEGAIERLDRPLAITRTPFGYVHRATEADPPDLFRLGDQAAVIHAFAGDGMSLALHSARLAADVHLAGGTAQIYHRQLRRDVAAQIARSRLLFRVGQRAAGQRAIIAIGRSCPAAIRLAANLTRVRPAVSRWSVTRCRWRPG